MLYIVIGSVDEVDYQQSWPVIVYKNHGQAKEHVEAANAWIDTIWHQWRKAQTMYRPLNPYDKEFDLRDPDTCVEVTYLVEEVEKGWYDGSDA